MADEELIDRILGGERESFRILVQRYHTKVINICIGLVHNYQDAEDIAQDVFIEIFQSLGRFRRQSTLYTWIYRIAVNKSINFLRKAKLRRYAGSLEKMFFSPSGTSQKIEMHPASDCTPTEILVNKEKALALHQAIDSLPLNQRIAFTLHKYEDLSYKDVAETMELSLSAVESLIHRAKLNLQRKLINFKE